MRGWPGVPDKLDDLHRLHLTQTRDLHGPEGCPSVGAMFPYFAE